MYYIVVQYAAIACKSEMIPLEHGTTPSGQDPTGNCPHRSWPPDQSALYFRRKEQRFAVNCERLGILYVTPEMWKKHISRRTNQLAKIIANLVSTMAIHGTSNLRSARMFCLWKLPGVDPHLEANSRDDSVRILGLAEQVLTQWTQWTQRTPSAPGGAPRKHPETSGNLSKSQK